MARLASKWPHHLGHLLTPRNHNKIPDSGLSWAVDNGAFSGLDPVAFRRLLRRVAGQPGLLWAACPDKVGDAVETLWLFDWWQQEISHLGIPVAFVGQDGQEDLPVPWDRFQAFFLGGSTEWKLSQAAADLGEEAKIQGKSLHMGRVNSKRRLLLAMEMGCDSVDGSSLSMFPERWIEKFCSWIRTGQAPQLWGKLELTGKAEEEVHG